MPGKRIVLLANSKKHGGRCVAGREIANGFIQPNWIRPVGNRPSHEVLFPERRYGDNSEPRVGDVLTLDVTVHQPHEYQTENWVLGNQLWVQEQSLDWATIRSLAQQPAGLWTNGHHTAPGLNDEMPHVVATTYQHSLLLVHVDDLEIHVVIPRDRKRVQARFTYNGVQYWLWITDVGIEEHYISQVVGVYPVGEACLTLSLSEPFTKENGDTCVYKLVAAVIPAF